MGTKSPYPSLCYNLLHYNTSATLMQHCDIIALLADAVTVSYSIGMIIAYYTEVYNGYAKPI